MGISENRKERKSPNVDREKEMKIVRDRYIYMDRQRQR